MQPLFRAAFAAAVLTALAGTPARADVKPHALFSDGAVLQQGVTVPVWGTCDADETVIVQADSPDGNSMKIPGVVKDGRWQADLPALKAGGPYKLTIKGKNTVTLKDVLVGEVWVASGQSNMEMHLSGCANAKEAIAASANPKIRLFTVAHKISETAVKELKSKWVPCDPNTVGKFSGVAYYFARDLQKALGVPVGIIHSSWGGTLAEAWTSREALAANPELKMLIPQKYFIDKDKPNPNQGTVLFNGMIEPLLPYAIKGVIWYQGESNASRAYQYRTLFPTMIQSWRAAWKNPEMPFLFVQLAPWRAINKEPEESDWAELREAQLLTSLKLPHTGIAVITDVGDPEDIHPKQKEPVGARLALDAEALVYGKKVEYSGPLFDKLAVDGNKAVLSFTHVGKGLEAKGGELTGFTVAGQDHKFYNAAAKIEGDKVVVTSDMVSKPVAVRYGWSNYPVVNLFNADGLPASPFRTDDFPAITKDKPPAKPKPKPQPPRVPAAS
jgi:sialate O-acetylesterase